MNRLGAVAVALLVVALVAGCAAQPVPQAPPVAWSKRQAQLNAITQFTLRGRLSSNSASVASASLFWRQAGEMFDVQISGPFGAGAVSISGVPQDVLLKSGDEIQRTSQPEAWLRGRVGWSLPVRGLRYWIVGLPAPDSPANLIWDERQRLLGITQEGWNLSYEQYQLTPRGELPRLLVLTRGDLRVKCLIDEWLDLPT